MAIEQNLSLEPGLRFMIELTGVPRKMACSLVGLVRGRYVLTTLPASARVSKDEIFNYLYPDNSMTVRFLYEGTVMGFDTRVIRYIASPFPLVFLEYPDQFSSFNLRKNRRITCLFHATALLGPLRHDCVVTDMSEGGCMVYLDPRLTRDAACRCEPPADGTNGGANGDEADGGEHNGGICVDVDDPITLECSFFGAVGESAIPCTAKRVEARYGKLGIGLKFNSMSDSVTDAIEEYVTQALHYLNT
ncbi:MAG: flagellar brake protein [Desulfovibrionaceae bacterium]|nr:flagellar brake protein [Desulfovibrionaceae bacterium]